MMPPAVPPPQESTLWAVKPAEKAKYDNIFEVGCFHWKSANLIGYLICFLSLIDNNQVYTALETENNYCY